MQEACSRANHGQTQETEREEQATQLTEPDGRKEERKGASFMARGRKAGARPHRPIFPVMRTQRRQSWAARGARGVATQPAASRGGRENPFP